MTGEGQRLTDLESGAWRTANALERLTVSVEGLRDDLGRHAQVLAAIAEHLGITMDSEPGASDPVGMLVEETPPFG